MVWPSSLPEPTNRPVAPKRASGRVVDEVLRAKVKELATKRFGASQFPSVDYLFMKESGWNYLAVNKTSGATGICQSLPASKMASAGKDYLTNPLTQVEWCFDYIESRYGTPLQAVAWHRANNWF